MGIDSDCWLAECRIQNDVGSLTADTGKILQFLTCARHFSFMLLQENSTRPNDIFRLAVNNPIVLMNGVSPSTPSFKIALNEQGISIGDPEGGRGVGYNPGAMGPIDRIIQS